MRIKMVIDLFLFFCISISVAEKHRKNGDIDRQLVIYMLSNKSDANRMFDQQK